MLALVQTDYASGPRVAAYLLPDTIQDADPIDVAVYCLEVTQSPLNFITLNSKQVQASR